MTTDTIDLWQVKKEDISIKILELANGLSYYQLNEILNNVKTCFEGLPIQYPVHRE